MGPALSEMAGLETMREFKADSLAGFLPAPGRHLILTAPIFLQDIGPHAQSARQLVFLAPSMSGMSGPNFAFVRAGWRGIGLPFTAGAFDRILAPALLAGLWQDAEIDALFAELWRITAPEGRLGLICRCPNWLGALGRRPRPSFSPSLIRTKLSEAGFSAIRRSRAGPKGLCLFDGQKRFIRPTGPIRAPAPAFQPV